MPPRLSGAKVAARETFPDGKARKVVLSVAAISRHATQMRTSPIIDVDNLLRAASDLPASEQQSIVESAPFWLPSTIRPAKPVTFSPVPTFEWTSSEPVEVDDKLVSKWLRSTPIAGSKTSEGGTPKSEKLTFQRRTVTRTAGVRVRIQREWFSSGEDERLGLVVWPPNLFDPKDRREPKDEQDAWNAEENIISVERPGHAPREAVLSDFQDSDR